MLRTLGVLIGLGLIVLGLLGFVVGIHAIFDPTSAQLSNDNDPFGTPPSRWESGLLAFIYLIVCVAGGFLAWISARERA